MLDDKAITLDLLNTAKQEVASLARACNEAADPKLRQVLAKQLQKAEQSQKRMFDFAKNKGYYNPFSSPGQMLSQDIKNAKKIMEHIQLQ